MPAHYSKSFNEFLVESNNSIIGCLTVSAGESGFYQQMHTQTESWVDFIALLKDQLQKTYEDGLDFDKCGILLEYPIPRRDKRIDCVLIVKDLILVIEYKDGEGEYKHAHKSQVEDYCLDLRDFHFESKDKIIIPILLASKATKVDNSYTDIPDNVKQIYLTNTDNLSTVIGEVIKQYSITEKSVPFREWDNSSYAPTPTIIEAAQALYAGKSVHEISRSHAGAENLTKTTNAIINAIKEAQESNSKIICFITGIPGAGKTLAGLNIVHSKQFSESKDEIGVFLSGNLPLIKVLTEALARDFAIREKTTKIEARREVKTFIQNVHSFIDAHHSNKEIIPVDNVVIFDEAQRAWDAKQSNRKFKRNFSEAEMMLEIMNRKEGSAVIVALIGGGQEINNGEAGLPEWGKALVEKFSNWKIYISNELKEGDHSTGNLTLFNTTPNGLDITTISDLHLNVALRSYRAKELSRFIGLVLDNKHIEAKEVFTSELQRYPIFLSRSLERTKQWLKQEQRGSRRTGLVATSGARRLRPFGLDVKSELDVAEWFLNPPDDVRSSFAHEIPATEFSIQGLELDWVGLCWDGDLRRSDNDWDFKNFAGTKWNNVNKVEKQKFILNKYRVLLTRAREGMIIWIPEGSEEDVTRNPKFYNEIYDYLKSCGIHTL